MLELKIHFDAKDEITYLTGETLGDITAQIESILEAGRTFGIAEYKIPFDAVSAAMLEIEEFVFGVWEFGTGFSILFEHVVRIADVAEILDIVKSHIYETLD